MSDLLKTSHTNTRPNPKHPLKLLGLGLVGFACLCAGTSAHAANRALLVGVGQYQYVNSLPGIAIDLNILRQWAPRLGFTEVEVLQDQQATYANVRAALQRLTSGLGPNDRALFYFSGHGAQFKDDNGDEADSVDEGLIMSDTDLSGPKPCNVLLDDEIDALINAMPNGELIVLMDACHSGTATKSLSNRGLVTLEASSYMPATTGEVKGLGFYEAPAKDLTVVERHVSRHPAANARYVALSAARDEERARASGNGSFFTLGLHEAFKTAVATAADITPQKLHDQTMAFIQANVKPQQDQFTPQLTGNPELFNKDIRVVASARTNSQGDLWAQFETLMQPYDHAGLKLTTDRGERIKIGQWYTLQVQLPSDLGGYLSVVAIDRGSEEATVLFPNDWMGETAFAAGATVKLPPTSTANWGLQALPPASTTLLVALVTPEPLQVHEKGIRKSRLDPKAKGVCATLARRGVGGHDTFHRSGRQAAGQRRLQSRCR